MGKSTINYYKWQFSIAMLVYQRVPAILFQPPKNKPDIFPCRFISRVSLDPRRPLERPWSIRREADSD